MRQQKTTGKKRENGRKFLQVPKKGRKGGAATLPSLSCPRGLKKSRKENSLSPRSRKERRKRGIRLYPTPEKKEKERRGAPHYLPRRNWGGNWGAQKKEEETHAHPLPANISREKGKKRPAPPNESRKGGEGRGVPTYKASSTAEEKRGVERKKGAFRLRVEWPQGRHSGKKRGG